MILLQQREEENRQEIAKLTAEIKALKVQLLEHRSKCTNDLFLSDTSLARSSLKHSPNTRSSPFSHHSVCSLSLHR